MTPPDAEVAALGEQLGPEFERWSGGWQRIPSAEVPAVLVYWPSDRKLDPGGWGVQHYQGGPRRVHIACASGPAAVAVAHLLVAVEHIAAGAELAAPREDRWRPGEVGGRPAVVRGTWSRGQFVYPHEARTVALELLCAAAST